MKKNLYKLSLLILFLSFYGNAEALTVSPAKIEITGDPGSVVTGEIEIFNEQDVSKTFFLSYENFEPQGDSGAPYFVGNKDGLATWIKTEGSVEINSGERIVVPYSITIPKEAPAGGYFSAIFFGNQPPATGGNSEISIGGKIGVLVLLRVSGYVEEKGGLLSFGTGNQKRFFTSLPVNFQYKLNNLGGDRVVPAGEITIKNTFWLTSAKLLANKNQGSVLPNSARKFEVNWDKKVRKTEDGVLPADPSTNVGFFEAAKQQARDFHFGLYTAQLNLTWGLTNQTAQDSFVFFMFPWQLLSILLAVLIILGLIFRKTLKRYNSFIIEKSRSSK